jgi:hypothetical protein
MTAFQKKRNSKNKNEYFSEKEGFKNQTPSYIFT